MVELISPNNKVVREYRRLGTGRYRRKSGRVILEGVHLLREALNAGIAIEAVLFTSAFWAEAENRELLAQLRGTRRCQLSDSVFNSIAQTESPQGVGAIAHIPSLMKENFWRKHDLFLLVLDRIQDPGNLGTIIRAAAAAAVDGVMLLPGTADPTNPKALRAGMGGNFYLPVIHANIFPNWPTFFKEQGIRLVAADPGGDIPYYKLAFETPTALVIGNESKGVNAQLLEMAAVRTYIPMTGSIKSLNAAMAATLFIFERQRGRNAAN
ncbi:MAG: RNA methyltransferase [Bacillota bacterium]